VFDQDERLILAMSSSGRPLISTMKDLSGRVLANHAPQEALSQPFLKESLRIAKAETALASIGSLDSSAQSAAEALSKSIDALWQTDTPTASP